MKLMLLFCLIFSTTVFSSEKSICGSTDDRILSNESEVGRASRTNERIGCTATMISATCAISAGHCTDVLKKVSFNVPTSIDTQAQSATAKDMYYQDKSFFKYKNNGEGDDWSVIKLKRNMVSGLLPGNAQGYLKVRLEQPVKKGQRVRVTGFGADKEDPIRNFAQQTHNGVIKKIGGFFGSKSKLGYEVDTMGGNSGSSVVLEETNEVIGIHAQGDCGTWANYNTGTLISKNEELKNAIKACLATEVLK
jgi:V8-like Glu-specific endopeptidase